MDCETACGKRYIIMCTSLNRFVCQDKELINCYLRICESIILTEERIPYKHNKEWCMALPKEEAVYIFRSSSGIIQYVGESACFQKRMTDLLDTRKHTLRRNIAEKNFSTNIGYIKPTSKQKSDNNTELGITRIMESSYLSYLIIKLGRAEFEEYMILKYKPIYNQKEKRK